MMITNCSNKGIMNLSIPRPDFLFDTSEQAPPIRPRRCSEGEEPFGLLSPAEFHELLEDPSSQGYNRVLIIDARFRYEYEGGHVHTAVNVYSRAQLVEVYDRYRTANVCVVVHCEFSQDRGPKLEWAFREHDRAMNREHYPHISFPRMFLLEGGYRRFVSEFPSDCCGVYVPMRAAEYVANGTLNDCIREHKNEWTSGDKRRRLTLTRSESDSLVVSSLLWASMKQSPMIPFENHRRSSM
jgi:hypothetical protein